MTDAELIAKQQHEIEQLKTQVKEHKERINDATMIITGIGGPMNDNKNRYTSTQLREWNSVLSCLEP